MKQKNKLQQFLIVVLITAIVSVLGMGFVKKTNYYESADRSFFSFFSMLRYSLFEYPVETVLNFGSDAASLWDTRYENDALRRQLVAVNHWQSRINELEAEVDELKELSGLDSVYSDYQLINGQIQARSLEKWDQVVRINIGASQGVEVDDGVISNKGLVGRVIEVEKDSALISLLTANNEYGQVAVKIQIADDKTSPGILSEYNNDEDSFTVKLLESKSTITEGMNVMTSGQGGVYPSGLYIGEVQSIKKVADSVGVIVYVETDVDFYNLKYISVVKKP